MAGKSLAILVGGSDLFSGLRGISKGTVKIKKSIAPLFDEVLSINYNYFLDFGRALTGIKKYLKTVNDVRQLTLYGYSKGGDVVLQLARSLEKDIPVELLITIDVANGPWSNKIDRSVPGNVKKNLNIFQANPNFPFRSYGGAAYTKGSTSIKNIDLTDKIVDGRRVNHSNIELLMVPQVIRWITSEMPL